MLAKEKDLEFIQKELVEKTEEIGNLSVDLNILKEQYTVEKIIPVDLFPNTYHVECITLLIKKD